MLAIGHVHVGDDVDDAAIRFLGQAFVFATVSGFHVEDWQVKALGSDDGEAAVRVPENEDGIGFRLDHRLIAFRDDVPHGFPKVLAHRVEVEVRRFDLKIAEEDSIEVVIVILAGVNEEGIEIFPGLVDDRGEANDLGPSPHDDHQLELAVVLKMHICPLSFNHVDGRARRKAPIS